MFETEAEKREAEREALMNEAMQELLKSMKKDDTTPEDKASLAKAMDGIIVTFFGYKTMNKTVDTIERSGKKLSNELKKLKDE